ncbi:transposase [Halovibrio variabilis]|uniref:transposase n=1 Tax=Halovibrio variabilis TaxID=31910 RepID=UPI0011BF31EB
MAIEQRRLKHKTKFSTNWKKQKARIAKLKHAEANARHDALHKVSTSLCQNHPKPAGCTVFLVINKQC